jgi:hypothetical protein
VYWAVLAVANARFDHRLQDLQAQGSAVSLLAAAVIGRKQGEVVTLGDTGTTGALSVEEQQAVDKAAHEEDERLHALSKLQRKQEQLRVEEQEATDKAAYERNRRAELTKLLVQGPPCPSKSTFWKRRGGSECQVTNLVPRNPVFSQARPWSIRQDSFPMAATGDAPTDCTSVPALLGAVKLGKRVWVGEEEGGPLGPLQRQGMPSVFHPFGCSIPAYSEAEATAVLGRFDQVVLAGDSLTRHLYQAMLVVLGGDEVSGGVPNMNERDKKKCRCDGMFSEADGCRSWFNPYRLSNLICKNSTRARALRPIDYQIFPTAPGRALYFHWQETDGQLANPIWPGLNLCGGPKLLVMQGGLHFHSNTQLTLSKYIFPQLEAVVRAAAKCDSGSANPTRTDLVWLAHSSQSRALDSQYPQQSRDRLAVANAEIALAMHAKWKEILAAAVLASGPFTPPVLHVLDFLNLTSDAQTSDGLHSLTDANVAKAFGLLRLIELVSKPVGAAEGIVADLEGTAAIRANLDAAVANFHRTCVP